MKLLNFYFSPKGKMTQRTYWLALVLPMAVLLPICLVGFFVSAYSGPHDAGPANDIIGIAFLVAGLVLHVYVWTNGTAKRLRDRGHRGWLALLNFVPWCGLPLLIYCGFWPSRADDPADTKSPNES